MKNYTLLRNIMKAFVLCLFTVMFFSTACHAASKLKVHFIDIGQGNATLIQYQGKNTLVDTGKYSEYEKLTNFLFHKKVKQIHQLIVTHNDSDHMGSAASVIRDYKVATIVRSTFQDNKDTACLNQMEQAIQSQKVKIQWVKTGSKISFGKKIKASVLSPSQMYSDSNENSVVFKLTHGQNSFLFMGDADSKIENYLNQNHKINVDVLQIGHHGSAYSSGILFLSKTSPQYAVISVGANNPYHHPSDIVMKRLPKFAPKIYRTDKNGNVTITSNRTKLKVNTTGSSKAITGSSSKAKTTTSKPATTKPANTTTGSIIGNVNTHVYHSPSCGNLPYEKNRRYFSSAAEAKGAGYRPHTYCIR